jgi:hypothetical protein
MNMLTDYDKKMLADHPLYANSTHVWDRNADGSIDQFALDVDYHNGPRCVNCGESFCWHCTEDPGECREYKEASAEEIINGIDDALFGKKSERIRIEIPKKFKVTFSVAHRDTWANEDIVEVLSELIEFLKAPVEEDTEIF